MICCGAQQGGLVKAKLIITAVALLALGASARTPAQSSETSIEKKIDSVFSGVTSPDAPGLAVLVRTNGRPVFEHGYGVRDLRSKAKIDALDKWKAAFPKSDYDDIRQEQRYASAVFVSRAATLALKPSFRFCKSLICSLRA